MSFLSFVAGSYLAGRDDTGEGACHFSAKVRLALGATELVRTLACIPQHGIRRPGIEPGYRLYKSLVLTDERTAIARVGFGPTTSCL